MQGFSDLAGEYSIFCYIKHRQLTCLAGFDGVLVGFQMQSWQVRKKITWKVLKQLLKTKMAER